MSRTLDLAKIMMQVIVVLAVSLAHRQGMSMHMPFERSLLAVKCQCCNAWQDGSNAEWLESDSAA